MSGSMRHCRTWCHRERHARQRVYPGWVPGQGTRVLLYRTITRTGRGVAEDQASTSTMPGLGLGQDWPRLGYASARPTLYTIRY